MTGVCSGARCYVWAATMTLAAIPSARSLGNEKATLSFDGAFYPGPSIRQDFCERYNEMISTGNSISLRNALSGTELSVSLLLDDLFRYTDEEGIDPIYPGINAQILDYIAEKANFTWRNSFGILAYDQVGNRTFTELLELGVEKYDLMAGQYTPSLERIDLGVSFVEGYYDGSLIMVRVVKPVEKTIPWANFMDPFTPGVWFTIFAVTLFSSVAFLFIENIGAERGEDDTSFRAWVMGKLYHSFITLTGNYSYEPKTLGGRFYGVVFATWAMIITATYTANLASLLVSKNMHEPKLNDIRDAVAQRLPICVHASTYSHDYIKKKFPESIPFLVPLKQKQELYDALNRGDCEILIGYKQEFESELRRIESNPDCMLEYQGRTIETLMDAFATKLDPGIKCTGLVNNVFSYYIKEMKANGFLDELWEEHANYYGVDGHCQSDSLEQDRRRRRLKGGKSGAAAMGGAQQTTYQGGGPEEGTESLGLEDMAGTMLFQVVGSVLAVVIALVAGFDRKTKEKRSAKRAIQNISKYTEKFQSEGVSGSRKRNGARRKGPPRYSITTEPTSRSSDELTGRVSSLRIDTTGRIIDEADENLDVSSEDSEVSSDDSVSSETSLERQLDDLAKLTKEMEILQYTMKKELVSLNRAVRKSKKTNRSRSVSRRDISRTDTSDTSRTFVLPKGLSLEKS